MTIECDAVLRVNVRADAVAIVASDERPDPQWAQVKLHAPIGEHLAPPSALAGVAWTKGQLEALRKEATLRCTR